MGSVRSQLRFEVGDPGLELDQTLVLQRQVPSLLGLAVRAPYMHDGCAETLRDRFDACGGGEAHGHTAHLSEQQLSDLIAFLASI